MATVNAPPSPDFNDPIPPCPASILAAKQSWGHLGDKRMWDPFSLRWVSLIDIQFTPTLSDGTLDPAYPARHMLYTHDRKLYFVEDFVSDLDAPPAVAGRLVDPREIWPVAPEGVKLAPTDRNSEVIIGRPDPDSYDKKPDHMYWHPDDPTTRLDCLAEVTLYERLLKYPHPDICEYQGCQVEDGLVTAVVLKNYPYNLETAYREALRTGKITSLNSSMILSSVRSALDHLHSLGLAHNNLTPRNVLLTADGSKAVLSNFDESAPFGEKSRHPRRIHGIPETGWTAVSGKEQDDFMFRKLEGYVAEMKTQAGKGELQPVFVYAGTKLRADIDREKAEAKARWDKAQNEAYERSMKAAGQSVETM